MQGFNPFHPLLYRQYVHRTPFTIPGINFKLSLSINFCRFFKTDSTIDKLHGGRLNLDWIVKNNIVQTVPPIIQKYIKDEGRR